MLVILGTRQKIIPTIDVKIIEQKIPLLIPLLNKTTDTASPNRANKTRGSDKLPNVTNVESSATIITAFLNPTKAIKNTIPAPTDNFKFSGIVLIIFS